MLQMNKIKELAKKNIFLVKSAIFIIIFVLEILLIKLSINTGASKSFSYLSFNFQSTELPLYFFLIFFVIARKNISGLKLKEKHGNYAYLALHLALITGFYFLTVFIIKNPVMVENSAFLFKIGFYAAALAPALFLLIFLFPLSEAKELFLLLKKEAIVSIILSFAILYLFDKISISFAEIGMASAKLAIFLLQKFLPSLEVIQQAPTVIYMRYGLNSVIFSSLCSGVIGFVFYVFFSLTYYIVNFRQINKTKYLAAAVMGFIIFLLIDVLRNFSFLFVWTLAPKLGVELFHSNLRSIYYTISLVIIFLIFRKWVKMK